MQENEFEKKVRQKMDEFSLVPSREVWEQVEARIAKPSRKRPIFLWMIAAVLLVGSLLWWMMEMNNTKTGSQLSNDPTITLHKDRSEVTRENVVKNSDANTRGEFDRGGKRRSSDAYKRMLENRSDPFARRANKVEASGPSKQNIVEVSLGQQQTIGMKGDEPRPLRKDVTGELPLHKYYRSPGDTTTISIKDLSLSDNKIARADTLHKSSRKSKRSDRRWRVGFTAYAGFSDNTRGIDLGMAKSVADNLYQSTPSNMPGGSMSGGTYAPPPSLTYDHAKSYGAGVFFTEQLLKRVSVAAGVNYHFFSARSGVGNVSNGQQTVYDSLTQRYSTVSSYYNAGQTASYTNKYHIVQVPVDLQLQLNKNFNKPLFFTIGLSPSLLVASDALYRNLGQGIYYKEKHQFKNFLLFGQTGLLFTPFKAGKYQLGLGPVLQYDLNSFSKSETLTRQHLTFIGIKSNITFK